MVEVCARGGLGPLLRFVNSIVKIDPFPFRTKLRSRLLIAQTVQSSRSLGKALQKVLALAALLPAVVQNSNFIRQRVR
jgi:hypothetical protein